MDINAGEMKLGEGTDKKRTRLIDHLAASLKKAVPGSHAYTLYMLSTRLTPVEPLISSKTWENVEVRATDSTLLSRKVLILAAEKIFTSGSEKEVLVAGVEIHEYHDPADESLVAYISKVDTTGCHSGSVTPTRHIVSAYLNFYSNFDKRNNENSPNRRAFRLHLFARSQPQYLFHLSSKNPTKHILECSKLVRWWKGVLQQTFFDAQVKNVNDIRGWFFIPGVTNERSARTLINDVVSGEAEERESQFWQYGYPYSNIQRAIDVIPKFEDDAKSRWLRHIGDSPTVKEFWELVSHGGEFAGSQFAGFFWIYARLNDRQQMTSENSGDQKSHFENLIEKIGGLIVDVPTYKKALGKLLDQSFQSEDAAIESTLAWNRYFANLHDDETLMDGAINIVIENPTVKKEVKREKVNVIPVNNLQMSIKRKMTPSSIPPPLIKRVKDS
ncbi:13902_t:CDS:2 [Acaulospora colombiana]|uniref:13902_t:CDS:1 n=1 Tax=Acaulospora colombiana TaxID=27376 RepID=A0ACA9LTU9_9GLOM|nr:13902_t:CDS:2 [Acaulospora colombiana]